MKIKEIFQSLDFKNNKIFNAKLGSEITDEKHIVDKKYVDDSFVYSTELSQRYKDSLTIERMTDNDGKTLSQLFDQLLFGKVYPKYDNPSSFVFNVTCQNVVPDSNNRFYNGLYNRLFIYIETVYNDRTYNEDPTLTINGIQCQLIEKTDNRIFCFKSNVVTDITNVVFTQKFGAYVGVPKQDNYGEDYNDPEFQIVKIINTNFTSDVTRRLIRCNPVLVSPKRTEEGSPSFSDSSSFSAFSFSFTDGTTEEIRDILIPEKDFNRLKYVFLTNNDNPSESCVCDYNLLSQFTNMESIEINNIKYLKAQYSFGYCFPDSDGINKIGLYV